MYYAQVSWAGDRSYIQAADEAGGVLLYQASKFILIIYHGFVVKLFHHVELEDYISVGAFKRLIVIQIRIIVHEVERAEQ